jgi:hypothetical protein
MLKKVLLLSALISLPLLAGAETCPSVNSIRSGNLQSWAALNSTSDNYASKELVEAFEQGAKEFWLAEWKPNYSIESFNGFCYYENGADVYLAKDVPQPQVGIGNWREDKGQEKIMQCYSTSVADCSFN